MHHEDLTLFTTNCLIATYEVVVWNKKCTGSHKSKGFVETVDECADRCKHYSMFIYGIVGTSECKDSKGCRCYCEADASADGTCALRDSIGYTLHRFAEEGKIYSKLCMLSSFHANLMTAI